MVMVYVPEGEFEMGTTDEQRDRFVDEDIWEATWNTNEQPVHTVYLDAFWIDQTEVTNGQYALCVADGACQAPHSSESDTRINYYGNPEFEDYPVVYADWPMADAYCTWAGRRLPTEAEWEKAARGTDGRTYPWGEGIDTTLANYGGESVGNSDTKAVGSYIDGASPYGALDMAGNVREWVADEFDNRYYHDSPSENPSGPTFTGTRRVIRGGSWQATANSTRSACRYPLRADHRDFPSNGFRCAASP
jgi:serine/threonine-protein kinase